MSRTVRPPASGAVLLCALVSLPARAVDGFVIGLEGTRGGFSMDGARLAAQVGAGDQLLFTSPLDGRGLWGTGIHLGWNVKGHAAVEAAVDGTGWDLGNNDTAGGAGFAGLRVTWFPAQLAGRFVEHRLLADDRPFDFGVELGGGYAIAGGPRRGVEGGFIAFGLLAEYYPVPWVSTGLFWRENFGLWKRFVVNYKHDAFVDLHDWTGDYGAFGLAVSFHMQPR